MGKKLKRIISLITSVAFITANAEIPLFVQATDFKGFDIKAMTAAFSEYKSLSDIGYDHYEQITDMYPLQMMSPVTPEYLTFDDQYNGEVISSPININNISELVELSKKHPASYQNAKIVFAVNAINNDTADFYGLGSEKYPFMGTMEVSGNTPVSLVLNRALFNYVCDSAELNCKFILIRGVQDVESSLLADHVIHNDKSKGTWDVTINKGKDPQLQNVETSYSFSGIIGKLDRDSEISLSVTDYSDSDSINSGNAGFFCNEMMENSKLTVSYNKPGSETAEYSVTSSDGRAGSVTGSMEKGSKLVLSSGFSFGGAVSGKTAAGGLVGYANDAEIILEKDTKISEAYISASNGSAGGFAGSFICSSGKEIELNNFSSDKISVSGTNAGGVFGYAENSSANGDTLKISSSSGSKISSVCFSDGTETNYGGVIGKYSSAVLKDSLEISGLTSGVSQNENSAIDNFGGVIGRLSGKSGSYAKIENVNVSSDNQAKCTNFGGIIAYSDGSGNFNDYRNVTVSGGYSGAKNAGGLIGYLETGVLRLSGETDMTGSVVKPADSTGQLVGNRGNALVYALGSGSDDNWTFKRCNSVRVDDIGNWGEVVRLVGEQNIEEAGIISADTKEHKITVNHVVTSNTVNTAEINSLSDFIKLALNMQLNTTNNKQVLSFAVPGYGMTSGKTININQDIDLAGTGIIGMTRDDSSTACSVTVNGNGNTVTLSAGEAYGMRNETVLTDNDTEGNGKIYRHDHIGLIPKAGNNSVFSLLNIGGSIYVGPDKSTNNNVAYIGGCIGLNESGTVKLKEVSAEEKIYIDSNVTNTSVSYYAGGLIGYVSKADLLDITGSSFSSGAVINNKNCARCYSGGIIGGADSMTVCNFTDTVLSGEIITGSDKDTLTNGMAGGLICFIKNLNSNSISRTLNLKNVSVDGLEMKIYSSAESGGILGYKWYNSNVYFGKNTADGVDVKNCTIFTSAKSACGLVYLATGYWQVNGVEYSGADIDLSKAENFGLLVNKAYKSDSSGALYVELTDTDSYNIASSENVKLNYGSALKNFDEIAAYTILNKESHSNRENGIVSVPAVDAENKRLVIMDGVSCNTYHNQTGISIGNPNTRYYYNLDDMRKKNKENKLNDSEKFMLWSVSEYACLNISGLFKVENYNAVSGNIDLKGYSYYPIDVPADADITDNNTVINNADFIFYFREIKESEESDKGDTIERIPDSSSSQHYMMHYGIFKNMKCPKLGTNVSLIINRKNNISGSIGYDPNYSGALLCGTSEGIYDVNYPGYASFKFDENTDLLLKDLYIDGYSSGYAPVLINKVGSYSNCKFSGIKTFSENSEYYKGGQTYAAGSLIGNVGSDSSSSISVVFERMVLDSRKMDTGLSGAVNSGLTAVYHTSSCIFSGAVFMESFKYADAGSTGIYNFAYDEDWGTDEPRNVTYGFEISGSSENFGKQHNYFMQSERWTSPVDKAATEAYDFSGFMPYIKSSPATGTSGKNHELKVNIFSVDLNKGCGTYGDPYIIENFDQLSLVSNIIDTGIIPAGSKINYNAEPEKLCSSLQHSENHKEYSNNDKSEDLKNYLRKAYYVLDNEKHLIEIPASFKGLGDKDDDTKSTFMGVIVGKNGMKLIMEGSDPFIKISAGSVIKDLEIEYANEIKITQEHTGLDPKYLTFKPGYEWGTPTITQSPFIPEEKYILSSGKGGTYFGGVIGQILGGDNILDNVKVTFDEKVTVGGTFDEDKKTYDYLIPVGGYVGVVRNGGLIFRNMENYSGLTSEKCLKINDNKYYYINPVIGRVLDAYAVYMDEYGNEPKLDNGNKNYVISSLTDPFRHEIKNKITIKANNNYTFSKTRNSSYPSGWSMVSLNDAESLFVFSIIISSGAASMEPKKNNDPDLEAAGAVIGDQWTDENLWYCKGTSYAVGRTHLAQYSYVGDPDPGNNDFDKDFEASCEDANNISDKKGDMNDQYIVPFIVRYYTEKMYDKTVYDKNNNSAKVSWPARLLAASFTRYSIEMTCKSQNIELPAGFRGINSLFGSTYYANYSRIYIAMFGFNGNNNHFYISHNVKIYQKDNYRLLDGNTNIATVTGVGFFNKLVSNSDSDIAAGMSGKTPPNYQFNNTDPREKYAVCDLTLSGNVSLDIYNFDAKTLDRNYNNSRVGGLVGSTDTINGNNNRHIYFDSIKLEDLSVSGGKYTGGLIGFVGDKNKGGSLTTKYFYIKNVSADNLTVSGGENAGGLAGRIDDCSNTVLIDGSDKNGNIAEIKIKNICANAISNSNSYAGGLAGYINKDTEIKNYVVTGSEDEINVISESFSGGIAGYSSSALTINNCVSKNLSVSAANKASSIERHSGGLIGKANSTLNADKCEVTKCHIIAGADANNTSSNNIGCVAGYVNGVVSVNNTKITDNECRINVKSNNGTSRIGYLFGCCKNNVTGYNLYSSDNYYTCDKAPNTLFRGNWIGSAVKNMVKLYSVSKQGQYLVEKDIGGYGDNINEYKDIYSIIIYADYSGKIPNTKPFVTSEAGYSPYVNINPKTDIGNLALTGDGAAAYSERLYSSDIMQDSIENSSDNMKKYVSTNIQTYSKLFYDNNGKYRNNYTTYQNVETDTDSDKKISGTDFPVILIDTNDSAEITNMINSYISVLTNEDQAGQGKQLYSNIKITTYRWNDSTKKFSSLSDDEKSMIYRNNTLYTSIGKYDNERKQFTLLDVQYTDPSGASEKIVYHLYIPVMVKRLLQFKFDSKVRSGTDYNYSDYLDTNRFVIENHGSSVTSVITYSYVRSAAEWQEAINSGEDLLWNFDKEIYLSSDDERSALPPGSDLILTDRSRAEMKYSMPDRTDLANTFWLKTAADTFVNKEAGKNLNVFDLSKMKSIDGSGSFSELTLAELLLSQAKVYAEKKEDGKLVRTDSASAATAIAVYKENGTESVIFLRPFSEESDEDEQRYSVTVQSDKADFMLNEVYYLTVRDSENNTDFVKNYVSFDPHSLKNPSDKAGLPTHKISGNEDVCSYVLGNFFDQSVEVTTNNPNDIINADDSGYVDSTYKSTISFKDPENKSLFISYSDKLDLYQKFDIFLRKVNETGGESAENICGRTFISSEFSLTQINSASEIISRISAEKQTVQVPKTAGSYAVAYPGSIKEYMKAEDVMELSVEASVNFSYPDEQLIMEQFPARISSEYRDGLIYCGRSALAYSKEDLENSSICSDIQKDKINIHYYRSSAVGVRFTYNAYGDVNNPLGVYSQLGKNPSDASEEYNIKGAGVYNPSILGEEINKASKIKVSLSLYQKSENGTYTDIPNNKISDYIMNTDITFNNTTQRFDSTNGYSYEFDLPENPSDLDEFPVITTSFDVNSGSEFESQGLMYSNYKVDILVELYYPNGNLVPNSSASDYIIFTNARIHNKLINAG